MYINIYVYKYICIYTQIYTYIDRCIYMYIYYICKYIERVRALFDNNLLHNELQDSFRK